MGLLEENDADIIESIYNLHFLRFYQDKKYFEHKLSKLHIMSSSRYYQKIINNGELCNYKESLIYRFLPQKLIPLKYIYDIFSFGNSNVNFLWNNFKEIDSYYLNNRFSYILYKNNSVIEYHEYLNNNEIKSLDFEIDSIHWKILDYCNKQVYSLNEIIISFDFNDDISRLQDCIKELNEEFLLYSNIDFSENITIIDTSQIK